MRQDLCDQKPLPLSELLSRLNVRRSNFKTGLDKLVLVHTTDLRGMKKGFGKGRADNSCAPLNVVCATPQGGLRCAVLKRDAPEGKAYLKYKDEANVPMSKIAGQMGEKEGWLVVRYMGCDLFEDYIEAACRMR